MSIVLGVLISKISIYTIRKANYRLRVNTLIYIYYNVDLMVLAFDLKEIEERIGKLSSVQKILLGTDGSITQLLEAITGNPVAVETRLQEIVRADTTDRKSVV
jgi:hypothetical protein